MVLLRNKPAIIILAVSIFIAAAALLTVYIYASLPTLPRGMSVSGWKLDGLTYEQFDREFKRKIKALEENKLELRQKTDRRTYTLSEMGLETNTDPLMDSIKIVFAGNFWNRAAARWKMSNTFWDLSIYVNDVKLELLVKRDWPQLYNSKPIDARRMIANDDSITYVNEQAASRLNISQLAGDLAEAAKRAWGYAADDHKKVPFIELPLKIIPPKITVRMLREQGIDRKIIQFTTSFSADEPGRNYNIQSTAGTINNMLLKPGEIFDYGSIVAITEKASGYKEAPVIVNGVVVPGIGGGICQVSTTLYNAVIRMGLNIIERRSHSLPVSYIQLGQDATFAEGAINFKFKNNSGAYLLIRTVVTDRQITVKLFGRMPQDIQYSLESKVVETVQPPVKYVKNPNLRRGTTQLLQKGVMGYVVETYRTKWIRGAETERVRISRDVYLPRPALVAVNNGRDGEKSGDSAKDSRNNGSGANKKPLIEDGIKGPLF